MYITFSGKRMAIISIPTSVSGVSIPGSIFGGPLGSLYAKPGVEFVKYPRDLESSTKSHVVLFTIKEIQPVTLDDLKRVNGESVADSVGGDNIFGVDINGQIEKTGVQRVVEVADGIQKSASEGVEAGKNIIAEPRAAMFTALEKSGELGQKLNEKLKTLSSRRTEIKAYISLYMPDNISFNYNPEYDETTLMSVAQATPVIGGLASRINSILENEAAKFLLNKAGYVFNPQAQMLFKGINFRTFNMNFTFTPYSKKEAEDVKKIIKLLRSHAAPRKVNSLAGMFFVPPSIFGIEFKFNGVDNSYLNRVSDCVIEDIDVNYTPNGWAAYADGAPVQTNVTITFKEIALIDREMIEKEGY